MTPMRDSVQHGDCIEVLRLIADNTLDACVTDPPYGLGEVRDIAGLLLAWAQGSDGAEHAQKYGFMNKTWDALCPSPRYWKEVYRVLKPGAHLLVFAGTRTWDLMSMAIRLAGFESRDTIATEFGEVAAMSWTYGEGFPKSLSVAKAIDSLMGEEPHVIGHYAGTGIRSLQKNLKAQGARKYEKGLSEDLHKDGIPRTEAVSEQAKRYEGTGTNLKPAWEPILVFRKPVAEQSIAQNVLRYGTGGMNIDGCRIPTQEDVGRLNALGENGWKNSSGGPNRASYDPLAARGRWPANVLFVHSDTCSEEQCTEGCPVFRLDAQAGDRSSHGGGTVTRIHFNAPASYSPAIPKGDHGGPARYFNQFYYEPKAKKKERDAGCEALEGKQGFDKNTSQTIARSHPETGAIETFSYTPSERKNHHPTVKPLALMRHLVRLATPAGGTVLDPFAGSGSTLCAAIFEDRHFLGIEQESEYSAIARARIAHTYKEHTNG